MTWEVRYIAPNIIADHTPARDAKNAIRITTAIAASATPPRLSARPMMLVAPQLRIHRRLGVAEQVERRVGHGAAP